MPLKQDQAQMSESISKIQLFNKKVLLQKKQKKYTEQRNICNI